MISIQTLQKLSDLVWIGGTKPRIRYNNQSPKAKYWREKNGNIHFDGFSSEGDTVSGEWAHAHNHAKKGEAEYRRICFSYKGFNRSNKEVIRTLAHELAHLKVPNERHGTNLFRYWHRAFLSG